MTNAEKVILIEMALREAGIEMTIDGCGCCCSPWITFKHGDSDFEVEAERGRVDTSSKKTLKQVRAEQAEKRDLGEALKNLERERHEAWARAEEEHIEALEAVRVTTDQKEAEAAQERLKVARLKLRIAELNL